MTRLQMLPELGVEIPPACARVQAWRARPSWARTMFPPLPR